MWKLVGITAVSFAGGYTYYISEERKPQPNMHTDFAVGSAEERLKYKLKTGDVVLFKRQWHSCHIPAALLVTAYRHVFASEFDHCGVVVEDKLGNYYIYENCMFTGPKLRNFDERILLSHSARIEAVQLRPLDVRLNSNQRNHFYNSIKSACDSTKGQFGDVEAVGIVKGLVSHAVQSVFQSSSNRNSSAQQFVCPNVRFVLGALRTMQHILQSDDAVGRTTTGEGKDTSAVRDGAANNGSRNNADSAFCHMTCADVQTGNFFDNVAFFMFRPPGKGSGASGGSKGVRIRSRGQGFNMHVVFR